MVGLICDKFRKGLPAYRGVHLPWNQQEGQGFRPVVASRSFEFRKTYRLRLVREMAGFPWRVTGRKPGGEVLRKKRMRKKRSKWMDGLNRIYSETMKDFMDIHERSVRKAFNSNGENYGMAEEE